ncbi:protein RALF-like 19 [Gastrolobium bilobum]|uniref:protein RALF-like 19 n=1 Tax=Gastrolobium bilobum TaxID=150636 RepID=UPI002AB19E5B|nr:protein RALF-like 19 [Gastrolobium bilobum]
MASKGWLVFFLVAFLALAMVAEATTIHEFGRMVTAGDVDLIVDDNEFLMVSESNHRQLYGRKRYISYGALRANQTPCRRRGRSYYNCRQRGRANPYRRGCTAITHCARQTD